MFCFSLVQAKKLLHDKVIAVTVLLLSTPVGDDGVVTSVAWKVNRIATKNCYLSGGISAAIEKRSLLVQEVSQSILLSQLIKENYSGGM